MKRSDISAAQIQRILKEFSHSSCPLHLLAVESHVIKEPVSRAQLEEFIRYLSCAIQYPYTITDVRRYPEFEALVAAEDPASIAPQLLDRAARLAACHARYSPDKEAMGAVALEISPVATARLRIVTGCGTLSAE